MAGDVGDTANVEVEIMAGEEQLVGHGGEWSALPAEGNVGCAEVANDLAACGSGYCGPVADLGGEAPFRIMKYGVAVRGNEVNLCR